MMALQNGLHQRGWLGQMLRGKLKKKDALVYSFLLVGIRTPVHSRTCTRTHARTRTHTHSFDEHLWLHWLWAHKTHTFNTVPTHPVYCPNLPRDGVGWDSSTTCRWHRILSQRMKWQHNLLIMFVEEGFPSLSCQFEIIYRTYFLRYLRKSEKCSNQP